MNFFAFLPLVACFINISLWVFIFSKRLFSKTSYAYLYYVGAIGLFQWFEFMVYSSKTPESAAFFLRLQCVFWIPLGVLFLNFVYSLFDREKYPTIFILWLMNIFCVFTALLTSYITRGAVSYSWGYDHEIGFLFIPVVFLITIAPLIYSLIILLQKRFAENTPPMLKQQCSYILWGSTLALVVSICFDVVLPHIFKIDTIIRLSTSAVVIQTLFIYLAVRKYHFMWVSIEDAAGYIFRNVQDGIIILDTKNRIQLANQAAILLLKLDYSELYNVPISTLFNSGDYSPSESYFNRLFCFDRAKEKIHVSLTQSVVKDWQDDIGKVILVKDAS